MTGNEYQRLAGRTMNPALDGESTTRHALYGLASEVGEVMSIFQHALQEGEPISLPLVIDEMGDVLWFACDMCMKDDKAARKCELRKLLVGTMPPVEHGDVCCEYGVKTR